MPPTRLCMRRHPDPITTFVIGRNINYRNVCDMYCRFCAFYRAPPSKEGYVLTNEDDPEEDPGDGRRKRDGDSDAGRSQSRFALQLLFGLAAGDQGAVSRPSRCTPSRRRRFGRWQVVADSPGEVHPRAEGGGTRFVAGRRGRKFWTTGRDEDQPAEGILDGWMDVMRTAHQSA